MIIWLGLLSACRDPELDPLKDALSAYDAGRAAASSGDWSSAEQSFARAVEAHPTSPALVAWWAKSLAEQGQLQEARDVLTQGIQRIPEQPLLHYNRAAYAARAGDVEMAARGLKYLYARDMLNPVIAGEDPDFAVLASSPKYAPLAPPPELSLAVQLQEQKLLIGDRFTAELQLRTRVDAPITFTPPTMTTGVLQHERTVEDLFPEAAGWSPRRLTLDWRAIAVGEQSLGPVKVEAHGSEGLTSPMAVTVTTLPGRERPEAQPLPPTLWMPSAILGDKAPPWAGRLEDGRLAVKFLPGMTVSVPQSAKPPVQLEYREASQTRWHAGIYDATTNAEVIIKRNAEVVLRVTVP